MTASAAPDRIDVLVVGGGPAGIPAAIQAARSGARVLLVEKNGALGGTTTSAGVSFPGLFHAWGEQVIAGIGYDLVRRAMELAGDPMPDVRDDDRPHWQRQLRVNPYVLSAIQLEEVLAAGVDLALYTMVASVRWEPGDIAWDVVLCGKEGLRPVRATRIVDATGDADVVGLAGLERERSADRQPGTLVYQLGGYDPEALDHAALEAAYDGALAAGELVPSDLGSRDRPLRGFLGKFGDSAMHLPGADGATSPGRTQAEAAGRASLLRVLRFLRRQPGLEGVTVAYCAAEVGIRETFTVRARTRITAADYLAGRLFADAVCYSFYPIDVHRPDGDGVRKIHLEHGLVPTISRGAMVPEENPHLVVAGRAISGDQEANSAFRVQATAMATGQAAGALAALAARDGCAIDEVDLDEMRAQLAAQGAILPPTV